MLRLLTDAYGSPAVDTAVSTALLQRVAAGEAPPTLRLFTPERIVAFGRQDRVRPGYADAVAAVRDQGFAAVERLAGGRAATFHEGTLAFAWATPEDRPRETIEERFDAITSILVEALTSLGVDARVGEVPGEYCPGRHSISARGARKLVGTGQRLIKGAAHVGGVIVVDGADLVNRPLVPAYAALGYDWDPAATGAITEETSTDLDTVRSAVLAAFEAAGHALAEDTIDDGTLDLARSLAPAIA